MSLNTAREVLETELEAQAFVILSEAKNLSGAGTAALRCFTSFSMTAVAFCEECLVSLETARKVVETELEGLPRPRLRRGFARSGEGDWGHSFILSLDGIATKNVIRSLLYLSLRAERGTCL